MEGKKDRKEGRKERERKKEGGNEREREISVY